MKELQTLNQVSWPNPELEIPNILFCLEYDGFLCVRISRAVNRKSIALESTVKVEQNTHKEYMINAQASDPRKSSVPFECFCMILVGASAQSLTFAQTAPTSHIGFHLIKYECAADHIHTKAASFRLFGDV